MGYDLYAWFVTSALGLCFMTAATLPLKRRVAGWTREAHHEPAAVCENAGRTETTGRGSAEDQSPVGGVGFGGIRSHAA